MSHLRMSYTCLFEEIAVTNCLKDESSGKTCLTAGTVDHNKEGQTILEPQDPKEPRCCC